MASGTVRAAQVTSQTFDFIVVGSGSAGAVVARRLSENSRFNVLLLEAGEDDGWYAYRLPILTPIILRGNRGNWRFYTEPEPGFADRKIFWPRGKAVGGSSKLNGMLWVKGDPLEFDHWNALGNKGWGAEDVLPYFRKSEAYAHGESSVRGRDGPVPVSLHGPHDPLTDAFIAACERVGIPRNEDYNGRTFEGVGYLQFNTKNGLRWSTRECYLADFRKRPNLRIETGAHVTRVLLKGRHAYGVAYTKGGKECIAQAGREVILCAGTIQSPQLLELSGIGDSERLRSIGISVAHHLPGVGENLRDHVNARISFATDYRGTLNDLQNSLLSKGIAACRWLCTRRGPLSMIGATSHALARTVPDLARPDVKIQVLHLSAKGFSRESNITLDEKPGFTISAFALRPESQGSVHIKTADPLKAPSIHANYLTDERDVQVALRGTRMVRRIAAQSALAKYVKTEIRPGVDVDKDDEVIDWVRRTALTSYHPIGTCKMGSDPQAVVDSRLKVHGIHGLRVIDASIMPTMASSNTHAPTVMIGEKGASMILEDHGAC